MSQLGERFSNRNEARKRRAEAQERAEAQKRAAGVANMKQGKDVMTRPQAVSAGPHMAVRQAELTATKDVGRQSTAQGSHTVDSGNVKSRHPLAQSDVNHIYNPANASRQTASVGNPQKDQHQNTSAPKYHLAKAIAVHQALQATSHLAFSVPQRAVPLANEAPQALPTLYKHQSATTVTKPTSLSNSTLDKPAPPVIATEADTDTAGAHQNSDTSFDSLTDMDGLFDAGGEEVEALFRACDGF